MIDYLTIYTAYAWIGWAVSTLVLAVLCFVSAWLSKQLFRNIVKTYKQEVVRYWLKEMERNGTHIVSHKAIEAYNAKLESEKEQTA